MRTDVNYIKEFWDLFFAFSMAAAQMDPHNNRKSCVLDMEVEPVTVADPRKLVMGRPEIGCYIGNKANKIHSQ